MIGNLLQPELVELIRQKNFTQLRETLCGFSALELAEIFTDMPPEDEVVMLRILPHELAAEVFEYLPLHDQEETLRALGNDKVAEILNNVSPDDRTALLEELPAAATQKLLELLSPEQRKVASQLLGYPKNSVGRRMTPKYVAIHDGWTAGETLEHLRTEGKKRDSLNQLYVVDPKGRLVDFVALRNVVVSDPATPIKDLLENRNLSLKATEDQELAVAAFKKYDVTILPVVDSQDVLLGVITVDDILDVAEKEATEDIQKMGGMEALDGPYLQISFLQMLKKRAPWLSILFVSEMFTSTAMGYYEGEIEKAVVLSLFLPLILSSGGNSGSQATTLLIRAMALGDVKLRDWWLVFKRELTTGFMLGCTLGLLGFVRIIAWQWVHLKDYGPTYMLLATAIGLSLIGVVLWGSLIGAMLPLLLRAVKLDPATCSAPFVATLVDVTGIVIYFTVAFHVLHSAFFAG